MKIMIASDIHGSAYYCDMLLKAFDAEGADKLLLLGDILYHGPRNDLPREYNPKRVIELLNGYNDKLLCVRGNCDSEVDQMVLNFSIMADYAVILAGKKVIYATHGHTFNEDNLPPLQQGDILLHGHTHVPMYKPHENYTYINPGSVSIPKNGSCHSFMIMEDGRLIWKNLENNQVYMEQNL